MIIFSASLNPLAIMENFEKTPRNTVKRLPKRGHYDKATIYAILDAGFVCHLGFVVNGQPFVIPTAYGRAGDVLYVHGASTSRMLAEAEKGLPVCLTVTHVDAIVVARSAFHSSMNYRSAVIFGTATKVSDAEKEEALRIVTDHIIPGRWDEVRPTHAIELKATTVLKISIDAASAKVRTGGPNDDEEDYALPIWAGVLPLQPKVGEAIPDERLADGIAMPGSVTGYNKERFG